MKKWILLLLGALVLVGVIIYAIWSINESGKLAGNDKDSFIPYNSAVVININPTVRLSAGMEKAFVSDIQQFREALLNSVADTLIKNSPVGKTSKVLAMRVEGKSELVFLYVLDNKEGESRADISGFLRKTFQDPEDRMRRYDRFRIYSLKHGKQEVYFAVEEGMILLSDSELYIEDALKQFDQQADATDKPKYKNINKYFSAGAGINIFLNTGCFTDLLPLYLEMKHVSGNSDLTKWFKWAAFDGEIGENGIGFNGFMHYAGMEQSFVKTLEAQQPREVVIDGIIPSHAIAFQMLSLSDLKAYFSALEQYRYNAGLKDKVNKRKQELARLFGSETETDMRELLQGEFALVDMEYDEAKGERNGVMVAQLKSGGLCVALIEKMLANHARVANVHPDSYKKSFSIDRDKSFTYYRFPAKDMSAVLWGYIFDGVENNYALVVDNYLVFASSENTVRNFIRDYVHRSFVKDADWYKNLRMKLSAKYNMAYFADIASVLPYYKSITKGGLKSYLDKEAHAPLFSVLGLQWSNESGMLYNTMLLGTGNVLANERPHVLWQTKLDAKLSMKPVPVMNHATNEQELFIQDDNNTVYLVNDAGRILWKLPVDGKINSEVYQVDVFRNGKLQYLFSTPVKMYLVDRNGNHVDRFPVLFKSECTRGITMFDYDNDRNYRIFVPCQDREVYLYGIDGNIIKGWDSGKADKEIVSKVKFWRIGDKDYVVFADKYRLYIMDRKGNERVRVSTVFDLKDDTDIFLTKKGGITLLAFTNSTGSVNLVDFAGNVQSVQCGALSSEHRMNVADVDSDGKDDFIFTDGNKLSVYNQTGKLQYEKIMDAHSLDFPYVYRFSGADNRIGLLDKDQRRMLLLTQDANISNGFPIGGDSPFSITFSGNEGFYLFAGADGGTLIKYKVQR